MTDKAVSELTAATSLNDADLLLISQSGVSKKLTASALKIYAGGGTVTSVSGTGTVSGLTLSGTVTTTGNLTLSGTLDLSAPPAIGGTTPAAGTFTTLSSTGNTTLGDASADTVTFNSATVTLNNSTTISAASTKTLTLNGGAGSNGLVLDASNNVGIGTGSPGAKLDVSGYTRSSGASLPTNSSGMYYIFSTDTAAIDLGGSIGFGGSYTGTSTTPWATISGRKENATDGNYASYLQFATRYQGGGITERMRLDSSGNLGIGTSSPAYKLEVIGSINVSADSFYRIGSGTDRYIQYRTANADILYSFSSGNFYRQDITNSAHTWYTGNSERLRLDSSGNLGLGVTPSGWSAGIKAFDIGAYGTLIYGGSGDVYFGSNWYYNAGFKYKNTNYASYYEQINGQHQWYTAASGAAGNAISFTQAMTLDASGNLLVGDTAAYLTTAKLLAKTTISGNSGATVVTAYSGDLAYPAVTIGKNDNNTTTSQIFVKFYQNVNVGSGQINANGASAAAFGSFSDFRLKENITALPNQLANICALKPSEFDYKDGSGHQIGFIAQEMQEVYPDVVGEGEDGMLTITGWSKTEARLVKAIQELSAELNELKQKVNA